jgi:quercetin dioxygenase-like cupin family protein
MGEDKTKLEGRVLETAAMVDYQEGAVVSREIVRGEKGSLTMFAFDKGQGLSEHTAPFDATVLVLEGEAEVVIGGEPLSVEAGKMVIMPAGVPHALNAVKRFKMMLVMIRA